LDVAHYKKENTNREGFETTENVSNFCHRWLNNRWKLSAYEKTKIGDVLPLTTCSTTVTVEMSECSPNELVAKMDAVAVTLPSTLTGNMEAEYLLVCGVNC
jgi:hypothetical protein